MLLKEKKLRKADIVISLILISGSLFFFFKSLTMQVRNEPIYTSPGFLPALICIIIFGLSLHLLISAWKDGARINKEDIRAVISLFREEQTLRIIYMIIIFLVYIFILIRFFPFSIATFLYLLMFMYWFKAGSLLKILVISSISAYSISFIFGELVKIPLP